MRIYKAGFSVSRPKHIKTILTRHFCKYFITETIILRIMTTCTSCKTLYNVLSHTHITIGGLRRFTFCLGGWFMLERGGLYWTGKFMLEGEGRFMLVGERFCLVPRPHISSRPKRFGSRGPCENVRRSPPVRLGYVTETNWPRGTGKTPYRD